MFLAGCSIWRESLKRCHGLHTGLVAQSCLTPCDPMDCSSSGSYVCGIFQARIPEWVAISSSRGTSPPSPAFQVDSLPIEPSGKPDRCHGERSKSKLPCLGCKCSHLGMNHFQGLACLSLYVRDRVLLEKGLGMNGAGRKGEGTRERSFEM